jgi:hypothetical protein
MSKKEINIIQAKILLSLAQMSEAKFSDLNEENLTTDWFSYHLRQVNKYGWVEKNDSLYLLTKEGKKIALQLNKDDYTYEKVQRISVLLIIKLKNKYLIQQRKTEPFYGYWEFPTKKVGFGNNPDQEAKKLLLDETGLKGNLKFIGINHKIELIRNSTFDDKYYFVFSVSNVIGNINKSFSEGDNYWLLKKDFLNKDKKHFDLDNTFDLFNEDSLIKDVKREIENY